MTKYIITSIIILMIMGVCKADAQKMISDGTITYKVSIEKGKDQQGLSDAFDGAILTVQFKGTQARTDLTSKLRTQTVFYNGKTGAAVVLKESGNEKYMTNLSAPQWQQYNKRYAEVNFATSADTKTILGTACTKAVGHLKDGSEVVVYYNPDTKPVAAGYEYIFSDLPGLPMEYCITTGSIQIKWTASAIQSTPVNASRFDLPTSGYKILEYKQ